VLSSNRAVGSGANSAEYRRVLECTAAAARPRAARAGLSCAGVYISGAIDSNACPAGSVRIEDEAACRTAAAAAGKPVPSLYFVQTFSAYPRGCYYVTTTNNAYFNAHAVGAGSSRYQLLCAAVTTGALPPRLRFGRACAPMRDCCDGMGNSGLHVGRIGYEFSRVWGSICTGS
jgi:hypothetical protein